MLKRGSGKVMWKLAGNKAERHGGEAADIVTLMGRCLAAVIDRGRGGRGGAKTQGDQPR